MKTLVQCDFDGTVTEKDVSFQMLDAFAEGDWRQWLEKYRDGEITVGRFNEKAFSLVKADRQTLVDFVRRNVAMRPGLMEMVESCRKRGFRFTIVSNGLDFYICSILENMGIKAAEVYAAETTFTPTGVKVRYLGPDGIELQNAFKESYLRFFQQEGYRIVYIGNGFSDVSPAKLASCVFATDDLLKAFRREQLDCVPFADLGDVARGLEGCKD